MLALATAKVIRCKYFIENFCLFKTCFKRFLAKMLTCQFCSKILQRLRGYVLHCKIHRNEPFPFFKCVGTDCKRTVCTYGSKVTIIVLIMSRQPLLLQGPFLQILSVVFRCVDANITVKELIVNLKSNIAEGRPVTCPVIGCSNQFTVKLSFTAHISRKHRACSVSNVYDAHRESPSQLPGIRDCEEVPRSSNDALNDNGNLSQELSQPFLRNLCLFYLKLQGQLLLPASTIQSVVEEIAKCA